MIRNFCALLAIASFLLLPACMKMETKMGIKPDNTGTMALKVSMKVEVIDQMKGMMEQAGAEAGDKLDKLNEAIDEKAAVEKLKKQGVEITSSKTVDKDGWKGFEIEGKIADVNAFTEKAAKQAEEDAASDSEGADSSGMSGAFSEMALTFFKTADPAVGTMQIMPPLGDMMSKMGGGENPLARLDEASEEELQMIEGQFEMMKGMFALDQMAMSIVVGVPGEIVSMKGCTKTEDGKGVVYGMKGGDINLSSIKTMMGLKEGVSVDFKIAEGCKLVFKDRPKKDAEAATPKKEEKKAEKKGGLKIGEGG